MRINKVVIYVYQNLSDLFKISCDKPSWVKRPIYYKPLFKRRGAEW